MTTPLLINLAGLSIIVLTAALATAYFIRRHGRARGVMFVPAIVLIAIFTVITHLPWPGPDWDGCGGHRARPLLTPLRFLDAIERRIIEGAPVQEWLAELTISATALNLHVCIVIGAALALCVQRWYIVALIGAVMTLSVELSQLTGLFGLAPCPWRNFEVDDLILNVSGVLIGCAIARFVGREPPAASERS